MLSFGRGDKPPGYARRLFYALNKPGLPFFQWCLLMQLLKVVKVILLSSIFLEETHKKSGFVTTVTTFEWGCGNILPVLQKSISSAELRKLPMAGI
jgi:hypothetical protein